MDQQRLEKLMQSADMGWWKADFSTYTYTCSEYVCKLLGMNEKNTISFFEFKDIIRDDHQERIANEFASIKLQDSYEQTFPIKSPEGIVWVRSVLGEKETDTDGHLVSWGTLQLIASQHDAKGRFLEGYDIQNFTEKQEQSIEWLLKYMPIGYLRMKLFYDENKKLTGYLWAESNDMVEKILNIAPDLYINKLNSEVRLDVGITLEDIQKVIDTGIHKEFGHQMAPDKYCHCVLYSPQPEEAVLLFSDMSETVKAHQALKESEHLFHNIFESLPAGVELYDRNGYLIDINEKDMEIFGIERKRDILGINLLANPIFPPDLKENIRQRKKLDFRFHYDFSEVKNYYVTLKSGTIDLISKVSPLFDENGTLTNYVFINLDNTETTNAYSKIQEFQELFQMVGEFAKVGYSHFNAITLEGYALSSWYRNVGETEGTPLSEIIGTYNHYHPEDKAAMNDFIQKAIEGKVTKLTREMRVLRPGGHYTWTMVNALVKIYRPEDGVVEITCVNYDITPQKEIEKKLIAAKEKAEESDRLKSAFIANMSHEIRTPLNAIVGFSELLTIATDPKEKEQYLDIVKQNNSLLLQLISDILDLSKIEANTLLLVIEEVNARTICEELVYSFRLKNSKNIDIHLAPDCTDYLFRGDKNRITQILSNFIGNAMKFTQQGKITIGYHIRQKEIEFYVEDTGIGIPNEKQSGIFGRFIKLNDFIPGTGLGLSICKSLVEQMKGQIGVDSEEGKGSRFWFTLPLL